MSLCRMAAAAGPDVVALDCEMIGVARGSYLARVTIVDHDGRVILDEYIKPPVLHKNTTRINYRTAISGITKNILDKHGKSFPRVQKEVMRILEGKIVLGHALANDFKALRIDDWRTRYRYYDTTEIPFFMKTREGYVRLQPRKLKDLAFEFLGKKIQVEGMPHDSAEDARTVVELYAKYPDKFSASLVAPASVTLKNSASMRKRRTRKRKSSNYK